MTQFSSLQATNINVIGTHAHLHLPQSLAQEDKHRLKASSGRLASPIIQVPENSSFTAFSQPILARPPTQRVWSHRSSFAASLMSKTLQKSPNLQASHATNAWWISQCPFITPKHSISWPVLHHFIRFTSWYCIGGPIETPIRHRLGVN